MDLKMRCQYCSESKQVESKSDSALSRLDAAFQNGWSAVEHQGRLNYYCSTHCETSHRRNTKRHLTLIKNLTLTKSYQDK